MCPLIPCYRCILVLLILYCLPSAYCTNCSSCVPEPAWLYDGCGLMTYTMLAMTFALQPNLQTAELEELVSKALTAALAEDRFKAGIVIDSLSSEYLKPEQAARLLMACMGLQKSCEPLSTPLVMSIDAHHHCTCKKLQVVVCTCFFKSCCTWSYSHMLLS